MARQPEDGSITDGGGEVGIVERPEPANPSTRPRSTREAVVRVLLVEESNIQAKFLRGLLSKALFTTHHVTWVRGISDALFRLEDDCFDVVLFDLELADGSGLDGVRRIQPVVAEAGLPIVVISESADESLALEATAAGAQDYLIKGDFQARVLIRTLQQAIDRMQMLVRLEQARERELYLNTHDRVSGLPNRYLFSDRLSQALHAARRHRSWLGVLFLDLDRFSVINDTLGHSVGDQLLRVTGRRLLGCLRATDTAARIAGNEFAVLLPDLSQGLDAAKVAQNIERSLSNPFRLAGRELAVSASIGIAIYPEDGRDSETLMNHAEMAMRSSKRSGGNTQQFYTGEMNASSLRLLTLENDLRKAIEIEQEQLIFSFQPIVDGRTGRITAAEALMRWNHPSLGVISPSEFIPLAEARGLMIPIGAWALHVACRQIRRWQEAGYRPIPIAVNVSPTQFWHADFLGLFMQTLIDTGVDGSLIRLEITESCVMREVPLVAEALNAVRQLKVRTSIDDFGTGFSSLNVLRRLPLDTLKIDRSFVNDCTLDSGSAAVIAGIIGLAKSLGLRVVAEGVETVEQRRFLLEHDCPTMQGFLFSHPVPVDEFTGLIAADRSLAPGTPAQVGALGGPED